MEAQVEKVYVAPGNELQDGFKTLAWTLRRWKSQPISIVILHVTYSISGKDYVYTPCKLTTNIGFQSPCILIEFQIGFYCFLIYLLQLASSLQVL